MVRYGDDALLRDEPDGRFDRVQSGSAGRADKRPVGLGADRKGRVPGGHAYRGAGGRSGGTLLLSVELVRPSRM